METYKYKYKKYKTMYLELKEQEGGGDKYIFEKIKQNNYNDYFFNKLDNLITIDNNFVIDDIKLDKFYDYLNNINYDTNYSYYEKFITDIKNKDDIFF